MCRHLAYLGDPIPPADLVTDPPHSLVEQAYAPTHMRGGGLLNADGFGIGWFAADGSPAARYRRATPIWSDLNLPSIARSCRSGAFLAAVRSATIGMAVVETACAPFTDGTWLFSHNGVIAGWPGSVADLASRLSTTDLLTLEAPCDSAVLWALLRDRLSDGAMTPAQAVRSVIRDVERAAPGSRLNVLLVGRDQAVATTVVHTLFVRRTSGGVVLASEPLDDKPDWVTIPDRRLVTATAQTWDIQRLEEPSRHG